MLAEASYKYKATQGQGETAKKVKGVIDAENEKDAAAKMKASGMFTTSLKPRKETPTPEDNLDSDQDGTKDSEDPTPKDEPKKPDIRPGGHQEVPSPAEKAKILGNEKLQRMGLKNTFKIHGRSSAVGRTDPSRGVGAYKNAVGLGDVVDYIGAKGPGGVPKEVADRARIRGQQAVRQQTKIATAAKAEDDARAEAGETSVKGTTWTGGNTPDDMKAKDAATTAAATPRKRPKHPHEMTRESLEITIKTMLGEKNDI